MDAATAATTTMVAKYGKQKIELSDLPSTTTTIGQVKDLLREKTGILPIRQKLIGLKTSTKGQELTDATLLSELKQSKRASIYIDGTPEEEIFVDPSEKDDLPAVLDDFELDFNAGSEEWIQHKAKEDNLQKFTESTAVHIINPPRRVSSESDKYKPLLVLDLDHTLLTFREVICKRMGIPQRPWVPLMMLLPINSNDPTWMNIVEMARVKLTELGMLTHPGYKFCFVLDKTSMFQIPLQIIWTKFPHWGAHNTVHLDDLKRNFALNIGNGLKCSAYYRKKKKSGKNDSELLGLDDFETVQFDYWQDYVSGKLGFGKKK
ncbi:ubiquitin-like domain-containing CTD phosphatase [Skeletonema marinoi]|uniref:Ubiquitin-like domain-containing CTD phosphatase n=1 Tax=Skeletonema marinoi TaxID=267567 RepID=A0AAD9DE55_9STRA|nr:ubiquitin-like domain-containing CTD phosphatase [Skeletonema marinoi]